MKLLIGSVTKCEEIKLAVLSMDLPLIYQGKKGLQMVFDCASDEDEKIILRKVKDELKQLPELDGIFYNVTCG